MSVRTKSTTWDEALEKAFGATLSELHEQAMSSEASTALRRALELRSFLALAEEQVARVRDRVHEATASGLDMGELSADSLRMDVQWMEAALAGREGYVAALDTLLRTMPAAERTVPPVPFAQPKLTTTLPPAPPPGSAGPGGPTGP